LPIFYHKSEVKTKPSSVEKLAARDPILLGTHSYTTLMQTLSETYPSNFARR